MSRATGRRPDHARRVDRVTPTLSARWVDPCMPDVDSESVALFALDAAWVAALCFIQAALSKPTEAIEHAPVGRPDVADAPSH